MALIPRDQLDLFFTIGTDVAPKDQREQLERAWFNLSNKPRNKPIEHAYGDYFVNITSDHESGIATVFDHDLLIFITSQYVAAVNEGLEVGRRFKFTGYEYFKFLGRERISGRDYINLWNALGRLHHTFIETNIRLPEDSVRHHSFNLLSEIGQDIQNGKHRHFDVVIPEFIYENIIDPKSVLTLSPDYFDLTSGIERFLYLYARKSAGNQKEGWTESYRSLYKKSGVLSSFYEFTRQVNRAFSRNSLPEYDLAYTSGEYAPARRKTKRNRGYNSGSPSLTFTKRKE